MSKSKLKQERLLENGHKDDLTGERLPAKIEMKKIDTHRKRAKKDGGTYAKDNYVVTTPVNHMKEHEIYRVRNEEEKKLKMLLDARKPISKTKMSSGNRLLAYERWTDDLDQRTIDFLLDLELIVDKEEKARTKEIEKYIKSMKHPLSEATKNVKGVGPIALAYIIVYVDITKARYASSLWSYTGYHAPSDKRYIPGRAGGGNKTFRSAMFVLAGSFIKQKESPYKDIYYAEKLKLSASEKITRSKPVGGDSRKNMKWSETTKKHRHEAAIRKMMKHFLADLWKVWRTIEGLDTPLLYPEAILGHKGIVQPEERGWVYPVKKENKPS